MSSLADFELQTVTLSFAREFSISMPRDDDGNRLDIETMESSQITNEMVHHVLNQLARNNRSYKKTETERKKYLEVKNVNKIYYYYYFII